MQAIWKGTVSFGLVSIPVKLYAATEEKGISFRQVHDADGGRIKYKRVCSVDGEEVAYRDIVKGFELPDGDIVVLSDEDFAALPLPTKRTIDVLQFVPLEQIDGVYMSKPYYIAADGPGNKPYVLLRDALERSGRAALVKVALRNRESLAVMRPRDGALLVQTMLWPDEVRGAEPFAPDEDVNIRDQEVAMAESYISTLSDDFDPSAFTDDYRTALEELVAAKTGGRELQEDQEEPDTGGTVVDLMAALRASVEAAQAKRAGGAPAPARAAQHDKADEQGAADEQDAAETAKPARRTAAKQPAKKTAAKKTAGDDDGGTRKAAAKKTASSTTKATASKSAAKKAPAKKTTAKQTATKATTGTKKAAARKSA
ncbi:non-homologous end joining protein Ku [Motilibacter deserti]|uniref:Non-homologous end joining protein Ku n=1 Tax=Motilibacter deserti TaxID=2714956 RepID=A0ABX0GQZ6_9ACTN|nr:Ku protein [Motilibacter deserti]NHC13279.1 Ku protein [Motilibacter deserti]